MTAPRVLVVGEALVDVIEGFPVPGGSPANVAIALARQGQPVTLATQLGADEYGGLVRGHLEASGVELRIAPAARTSTATATIGPDGAATYDFDIEWDPRFPPLPEAPVVHIGSFSAVTGPAVESVVAGLATRVPAPGTPAGAMVSYDVNVRPALMPDHAQARIEALVRQAALVKASDEDLAWLYPDRPVNESAGRLLALGPAVVWVTRGAAGATAYSAKGRIDVPAPRVQVRDTIGAGDTFSAGLILGWLRWGEDWRRVGELAAGLAAVTASRAGADPPWA